MPRYVLICRSAVAGSRRVRVLASLEAHQMAWISPFGFSRTPATPQDDLAIVAHGEQTS